MRPSEKNRGARNAERAGKRRAEHLSGHGNAFDLRVVADAEIRRSGAVVDGVQRRAAGDDHHHREQAPDDAEVLNGLAERRRRSPRSLPGVGGEIAVREHHGRRERLSGDREDLRQAAAHARVADDGHVRGHGGHQPRRQRGPRRPIHQALDRDDEERDEDDDEQRRHDLLDALVARRRPRPRA